MKKAFLNIGFAAALLFNSCSEDFDPGITIGEKYVLYCVIQTDEANTKGIYPVKAFISKVSEFNGFDPSNVKIERGIPGAEVTLTVHGDKYAMTGEYDKSEQNDSEYVYTAKKVYIFAKDSVYISAKMPDGVLLSAGTKVPSDKSISLDYDFPEGFTSILNRYYVTDGLGFSWISNSYKHLFFPGLFFSFKKGPEKDPTIVNYQIAYDFVNKGGKRIPVTVPAMTSNSCFYKFEAIDSSMQIITADDSTLQQSYEHRMIIKLVEFNSDLSSYYSSVYGYLDHFSIRLDNMTYSNVKGGVGILGTSRVTSKEVPINLYYLKLFGY